jgi:ankyrin repeat protein
VISTLLSAGAASNARNKDGMTALMAAAVSNPTPKVFSTIIDSGADVNAQNKNGASA